MAPIGWIHDNARLAYLVLDLQDLYLNIDLHIILRDCAKAVRHTVKTISCYYECVEQGMIPARCGCIHGDA